LNTVLYSTINNTTSLLLLLLLRRRRRQQYTAINCAWYLRGGVSKSKANQRKGWAQADGKIKHEFGIASVS